MRNELIYKSQEDYKLNPPDNIEESDKSIMLEKYGYLQLENGGKIILEN